MVWLTSIAPNRDGWGFFSLESIMVKIPAGMDKSMTFCTPRKTIRLTFIYMLDISFGHMMVEKMSVSSKAFSS